jgi:hypothetical protein
VFCAVARSASNGPFASMSRILQVWHTARTDWTSSVISTALFVSLRGSGDALPDWFTTRNEVEVSFGKPYW